MKRIIENIAYILTGVAIAAFLAMLLLEAAVGCGEIYEDAQGVKHIQDCVFFNR